MRDAVKMPARRRNAVDLVQLQPGDLVVHEQHGIGRYVEMVSRTVHGGQRDYLIVEYAPRGGTSRRTGCSCPTDSLDQLTRYVGGEAPALSKLGGADWQKTKGRARKAVKRDRRGADPAVLRAAWPRKGYAFGPDTPWQRELEDAFPFQETPDQLAAIDEVKADMQQPVPMDRLICGDVGYGKTEIAVRAAFKAVQDGKQVARPGADDAAGRTSTSRPSPSGWAQFPVTVARALALPVRPRRRTEASCAGWPTARSTSSSAPTGCCSRPSGSRTSAWSSSTRSSGSASSTRSS